MPYKNVETLIHATGLLEGFELHLLSKIRTDRKSELEGVAQRVGANVVFHNGVTDEQYVRLLDDAFALVTASKDEGFGIPLVEAMQRGTPVVVSNLEIFHEVADSAASYFDPSSDSELALRIELLAKGSNWAKASSASIAQAARFDWDKSAEQLLKAFDALESK